MQIDSTFQHCDWSPPYCRIYWWYTIIAQNGGQETILLSETDACLAVVGWSLRFPFQVEDPIVDSRQSLTHHNLHWSFAHFTYLWLCSVCA